MLNPGGHFPSWPGAHFGRSGSNRQSSSGNDVVVVVVAVVVCAMALSGTKMTAVEYVREPNIIIKKIGIQRFLFCIYISDYLYCLLKMYWRSVEYSKKCLCQKQRNGTSCLAVEKKPCCNGVASLFRFLMISSF
jgi:hypothetical protein